MLRGWTSIVSGAAAMLAVFGAAVSPRAGELQQTENRQGTICRLIEAAAESNRLPASFLTRILWQESRFRTDVTSAAGAAGVAQFMPQTAAERGLGNPYDPGTAVAQAARFLAELDGKFGNLGFAAAAYNAGPARIAKWLHGDAGLPSETQLYVLAVTGRGVAEWRNARRDTPPATEPGNCLGIMAGLARAGVQLASARTAPVRMAMWQTPLEKLLARALRAEQQRSAATLCDRIRAAGAPCTVYEH